MRPEDVFQNIRDLMVFGGNITDTSELSGVTTITTDSIGTLINGMLIEVGTRVFSVSNITRISLTEWTFDIAGTNISDITWQLALYYEFGRALEIGNVQKDKREDPINKNKRFPLMWLLTDIQKNNDFSGNTEYEAEVLIAFIYLSEKNLRAKKRIDTKFEPILDPLVDLFKDTITNSSGSRYFNLPFGESFNIVQTDKFKYGSVNGDRHIFDDISDAIELSMNLKFFRIGTDC